MKAQIAQEERMLLEISAIKKGNYQHCHKLTKEQEESVV